MAAPANFAFNGLALALLLAEPRQPSAPAAETLAEALVRARGRRLSPSTVNRQDNSLQGWPWIAEEFSWVEPTAWCMLALKRWLGRRPDSAPFDSRSGRPEQSRGAAADRVAEAERLLADRMCFDGGWNYGNANMLGQELRPYIPTTAVALVALQDCRQPFVRRGLDYLIAHATTERSAMALGLARLALHVCGAEPPGLEPALEDCAAAARPLGAVMPLAIALYALTIEEHDAAALRLA